MMRRARVGLLAIVLLAASANASPTVGLGTVRPDVRLDDAWGRPIRLTQYRNMPTLVIYEDKASVTQNEALKAELAELARGDRYKSLVALIAVDDVSAYDFWPARGFVKSAIQDESRKLGTLIFCDWDGSVRRSIGLRKSVSNVVLYGRDDRVRFSHAGPLSAVDRQRLLALLAEEVAVTSPQR